MRTKWEIFKYSTRQRCNNAVSDSHVDVNAWCGRADIRLKTRRDNPREQRHNETVTKMIFTWNDKKQGNRFYACL
jgi:hypothetical protein